MAIKKMKWEIGTKPFSPEEEISLENTIKPLINAYFDQNSEVRKRFAVTHGINPVFTDGAEYSEVTPGVGGISDSIIGLFDVYTQGYLIVCLQTHFDPFNESASRGGIIFRIDYHPSSNNSILFMNPIPIHSTDSYGVPDKYYFPASGLENKTEEVSFALDSNGTVWMCRNSKICFYGAGMGIVQILPEYLAERNSITEEETGMAQYLYREIQFHNNRLLCLKNEDTLTSSFGVEYAQSGPFCKKIYYTEAGLYEIDETKTPSQGIPLSAFSGFNFFSPESDPDYVHGIKVCNGEIYCLGYKSTEIWYDSGAYPGPIKRLSNLVLDFGVANTHSFVAANGTYYFVSNDGYIRMIKGRSSVIISAPIQKDLNEISSYHIYSRAYVANVNRKPFIVFIFPFSKKYFLYNYSMDVWSVMTSPTSKEWINKIITIGWSNKVYASSANRPYIHELTFDSNKDLDCNIGYNVLNDSYSMEEKTIRSVFQTGWMNYDIDERKSCRFLHLRIKTGDKENKKLLLQWRNEGMVYWTSRIIYLPIISDRIGLVRINNLGLYKYRQWRIIHDEDSDFILVSVKEGVEPLK